MLYNKVRPLHARVEEITNELNDLERKIEQLNSKYSVTFICISKIKSLIFKYPLELKRLLQILKEMNF